MKVVAYLGSIDVWEPLVRLQQFLQLGKWSLQLLERVMAVIVSMYQHWNLPSLPHASPKSCMGLYMSRTQDYLAKVQVSPLQIQVLIYLVVNVVILCPE